jgi:hypothetical protein
MGEGEKNLKTRGHDDAVTRRKGMFKKFLELGTLVCRSWSSGVSEGGWNLEPERG